MDSVNGGVVRKIGVKMPWVLSRFLNVLVM